MVGGGLFFGDGEKAFFVGVESQLKEEIVLYRPVVG